MTLPFCEVEVLQEPLSKRMNENDDKKMVLISTNGVRTKDAPITVRPRSLIRASLICMPYNPNTVLDTYSIIFCLQ